jgi:hypothetical protein
MYRGKLRESNTEERRERARGTEGLEECKNRGKGNVST